MTLWHLVFREIGHRRWNFLLGLLSVTIAVGCLVASLTLLKAHEIQTRHILAEKRSEHELALAAKQKQVETAVRQKEVEVARALKDKRAEVEQTIAEHERKVKQAGHELQDAMRVITKGLGFNVLILPATQDLDELHTQGVLSETMPEDRVAVLSNSKIVTIRHLLPLLTHRLADWQGPRVKQSILVVGTSGEIPFAHRTAKKPLEDGQAVKPGTIVLGHEVARKQKLKPGDAVELLDRKFTVAKVHAQRGTRDDVTVWINLKEAQQALGRQNLINGILALECNCAAEDRVGDIRADILKVLPGTQVIEQDARKALARAEARNKANQQAVAARNLAKANAERLLQQEKAAGEKLLSRERAAGAAAIAREKQAAREDLQREETGRLQQRRQREAFAAILVPLVIAGCAVWIGLLTYVNVRQRSGEIGILRAIGLRSREILTVFLAKALLIGVLGAVAGYAIGFGVATAWSDVPGASEAGERLFELRPLLIALLVAPLLSGLASWIPAMLAARQDPAVVLQAE